MGLMICKSLVNINGGQINVFSEGENKGSCFSFAMKMELVECARPDAADEEIGTILQTSLSGFKSAHEGEKVVYHSA